MADTHEALYARLREQIREGKGVVADVSEDDQAITFVVALVTLPPSDDAMDRHMVQLRKEDGKVIAKKHVVLEQEDIARILEESGLGILKDFSRISNGVYGITYRASVEELGFPDLVVQMRFHGNIQSMNTLQKYLRDSALPGLPVPSVYPEETNGMTG